MLPNRTVAVAFVALMALSSLPLTAHAQGTGSDLVVTSFTVDNPIVNQTTTVHVKVRNVGTAQSPTFTVFVGWNDVTHSSDCLTTAGSGRDNTQPPACYVQFAPGLAPNVEQEKTFSWNVTPAMAYSNHGAIYIGTKIENTCVSQDNGCPRTDPTGLGNVGPGPDAATDNNVAYFTIVAKTPKVFSYPDRPAPPRPSSDVVTFVNDPWKPADAAARCKDAPAVTAAACTAQPGQAIASTYRLTNAGNQADTFVPQIAWPGGFDPSHYLVSYSPAPPVYVNPGDSKTVTVTVVVPSTEAAGISFNMGNAPNLTVAWVSQTDATVRSDRTQDCPDSLNDAGECKASTLLPFLVATRHGLNVTTTLKDNFTGASIGNVTSLPLVIANTGNAHDQYAITLDRDHSTINDSWLGSTSIPAPVDLDAGQHATATATLSPPANATKGYYTVSYLVQSTSTDATTPARVAFTLLLDQQYGLSAQLVNPLQLVVPGDTASFSMSVSNPGNGPENLTIAVAHQPPGWTWSVSNTTLTLPPFGSAAFSLNATVPPNTPPDTLADFFVNVSSTDPQDRPALRPVAAPMEAKVSVIQGPNAELTATPSSQFVDPGNTTTYTVHVRNVGNEASNFSVKLDNSDASWGATASPTSLVLNPVGSSGTGASEGDVVVTLRAPAAGEVGDISRLTLTFSPSGDHGRPKETVVEGRISGPDLFVTRIDLNTTTPYAGDPVALTLRVGNQGNHPPAGPVTVGVVAVKDGAQTLVGNVTLGPSDLRAGALRDVPLVWDTTGLDGSVVLQATIDPANAISEIDETNNAATRAVTLRTANAIRLVPAQGLDGHPGEAISYSQPPNVFQVQYTGNQPSEPVHVEIQSAHGWVPVGKTSLDLDLPRLALIPIRVDMTIPDLPGTSSDLVTVRVVPTFRPGAVVLATATTTVIDDAKPVISAVSVDPPTATLGQNVTIRASITDATGLSSVRANVVTPANDVVSLLMLPGSDGVYAVTQPWTAAGAYGVTLAAIDNAPTPNANDTHEILAHFTITPGSLPTIALAPGQPTTIRTGAPVKLAISDPLGIASANYTVRGVTYDMGRNYTLDTSGFASGTVQVMVSAQNLYHVPNVAFFNFTVDNTPPGIRSVTLTPSAPKAGEDATVRVETDAKVTAVQVLVKKDGQVVQTLNAIRKSAGVFEVPLNPSAGAYTLDVTAQDAAGNQKLSEGAVVFSAKAGNALPGPGVGLVALAVVAGALLLRRRR